ncbi:MAG TPA: glycoside hydrolase family 38 C-terminal domain-containing protein [Phycisphaerae bacterium]|nr:glycoside hydrolase family 38 C-terminal domain-containing protein [Phycisphaerae bacterium]
MSLWCGTFLFVVPSGIGAEPPKYDLSKDRVLYCVGYAHLDTQWRWDYCTTIDQYIKNTLDDNFQRFEKYPGYVFNFTGSVRYEMMKEYYPEKYERLKKYIAEGRWFVSGSSVDEGDVNVPSAEATIRQVLYGNEYFRREFGKESIDFMLPDCFGFPASMPSIWAHCGLKGFSTQKLTWGSAVGIPFKIGVWEGPDGKSVIAAFDPGPYVGAIQGRVDTNEEWVKRVEENGRQYGVWADYHYYGVGDQGGAPREEDIKNYLASIGNADGKIKVALVASDQMYKDITAEQEKRLPRYKGDLLLTEHSAGTLTSQAYMKRWNRKNEQLADAAERVAVAADWLGGAVYPREKLNRSWVRALANQMHDILPGTSIPRAYTYSWNDEVVALNGFAAVLSDSVGAIVRAMDTRGKGTALVVYNPLAMDREDLVEAEILFDELPPKSVRVFDGTGKETPSQIVGRGDRAITVLFVARAPSVGLAVFDVRASDSPSQMKTGLRVADAELENEQYHVSLDGNGDVSSIRDKASSDGRELLAAPAQLVFTYEKPRNWPAWNMDWADRQQPPIDTVRGPAKIQIIEKGPVRVGIRVERKARNSIIVQEIRLAAGDAGRRVEFRTAIDWQSTECALKAAFPLKASNPMATYNWGMGTIERGNNEPTKYEVPSHEWFELTDYSGEHGVSILEDCKFGSDKPVDHIVRLTLLYTPGVRKGYLDQHSQDWGRHDMLYALYAHAGDWRKGQSEWQGRRLNQPLVAFQAPMHNGPLGKSFSIASIDPGAPGQVDIRAVKKAEQGDWTIVRLQELWGRKAEGVTVRLGTGIKEAHEVDGQERRIGDAVVKDGKLVTSLSPNSPRSFAVRLSAPATSLKPPQCIPVTLPFDQDVVSSDAKRSDGAMDAEGRTMPAEMLPKSMTSEGITFEFGPTADGKPQAVTCRGQTIALPAGDFNRIHLLAAATEATTGQFDIDGHPHEVAVQSWTGFVGQFDDRVWDRSFGEVDYVCEGKVVGLTPGFIKRDTIAWFATHRHHPKLDNEAYKFSYLYKYGFDLPPSARELRLPDNEKIKILAVTLAKNENDAARPVQPLYDDFSKRGPLEFRHIYPPPPPPIYDGLKPIAAVAIDRKPAFDALSMGPPSAADDTDRSKGGPMFEFLDRDGEFSPHSRSGADGRSLPRLNDGLAANNDDDIEHCVWFDNQARFFIDLKSSRRLERINTYSWHSANRAPQYFSLWGCNDEKLPKVDFARGGHGDWTLIAVVDTRPLGQGEIHGSSVAAATGTLGPFRHLLWIVEESAPGTFFTEIDVHAAK